jgi:hypothetical protein
MIKHQPELAKHLPPLPEKVDEVKVSKHRHGGDKVEKDFGFECALTFSRALRVLSSWFSSIFADESFDEYIGAYAKQVAELAKAGGQL